MSIQTYTRTCIHTHFTLTPKNHTCDLSPGNTAALARIMDKGDTGSSPAMGGPPGPLRTPVLLKLELEGKLERRCCFNSLLALVVLSPRKLDSSLGTEKRPWADDGTAAASPGEPPELDCVGPARVALLAVVAVCCCCPCALSRLSRLSRPSVPDLSLPLPYLSVTVSLLLVLFVISRSDREFPLSIMASLLLVLPGACACVRETLAACAAESSALRSERKGRCSWLIWPWPMMRANLSPRSRSRLTGRSRLSRRSRPSFPYRELPVTASLLLVPCAVAW